jgi:hypothetical protein
MEKQKQETVTSEPTDVKAITNETSLQKQVWRLTIHQFFRMMFVLVLFLASIDLS